MRKIKLVAICSIAVCVSAFGYLACRVANANQSLVSRALKYAKKSLFSNVEFNTKDAENNTIKISADDVTQDGDWFVFESPRVRAVRNGHTIHVRSDKIATDRQIFKVSSNVNIDVSNGLKIKTDYAYIDINRKFAKADNHIYITYDKYKAQSDTYLINMQQNLLDLRRNVRISSDDATLKGSHFRCLFTNQKGVIKPYKSTISGNVEYKSKTHTISTAGLVDYIQNTIQFRSHTVIHGTAKNKKYKLETGAADLTLVNGRIQKIECRNKFKLYSDKNVVSGDRGTIENEVVDIIGNVEIKTPQGVARGKKARYNIKTGKLTMQNAGGVLFRKKKK